MRAGTRKPGGQHQRLVAEQAKPGGGDRLAFHQPFLNHRGARVAPVAAPPHLASNVRRIYYIFSDVLLTKTVAACTQSDNDGNNVGLKRWGNVWEFT